MNKDIKKLWVDALLSGDYEQGYHRLKNPNDKFCCLGVLCDVHLKLYPENKWVVNEIITKDYCESHEYMGCGSYLPDDVKVWSGLYDETYSVVINGQNAALARHNDSYKQSFKEIAHAIDEQL